MVCRGCDVSACRRASFWFGSCRSEGYRREVFNPLGLAAPERSGNSWRRRTCKAALHVQVRNNGPLSIQKTLSCSRFPSWRGAKWTVPRSVATGSVEADASTAWARLGCQRHLFKSIVSRFLAQGTKSATALYCRKRLQKCIVCLIAAYDACSPCA